MHPRVWVLCLLGGLFCVVFIGTPLFLGNLGSCGPWTGQGFWVRARLERGAFGWRRREERRHWGRRARQGQVVPRVDQGSGGRNSAPWLFQSVSRALVPQGSLHRDREDRPPTLCPQPAAPDARPLREPERCRFRSLPARCLPLRQTSDRRRPGPRQSGGAGQAAWPAVGPLRIHRFLDACLTVAVF